MGVASGFQPYRIHPAGPISLTRRGRVRCRSFMGSERTGLRAMRRFSSHRIPGVFCNFRMALVQVVDFDTGPWPMTSYSVDILRGTPSEE